MAKATPPSNKDSLSPTLASTPALGRVTRTDKPAAASLALTQASLLTPAGSDRVGAAVAVVSTSKAWVCSGPSLPAASRTFTTKLFLPAKVWPLMLQVLLPTLALAVAQLTPPLTDTSTVSPLARLAFKLPLRVWLAVWVMKSLPALPVSLPKARLAPLVVGNTVSTLRAMLALPLLVLPATSVRLALSAWLPWLAQVLLGSWKSTNPALMWPAFRTVVPSALPAQLRRKLSPTWAVAPLLGRPTRTVVALATSAALRKPSLNLLPPNSAKVGALGAVVSRVKLKPGLAKLGLPAASTSRTLKALAPSPPKAVLPTVMST